MFSKSGGAVPALPGCPSEHPVSPSVSATVELTETTLYELSP